LTSVGPTWTTAPGAQERLLIDCVTWQEAYAFCIWDGGFLPSEAEWEDAAAGGSEQREFPWGSGAATGIDPAMCQNGALCDPPPVGSAPSEVGRWGRLDFVGELSQWNLDSYAPYVDPCIDCANLAFAAGRGVRGAAYVVPVDNVNPFAPSTRGWGSPALRNYSIGWCARSP
jgi:formylglycine-generating enzyme required for sulfatase activity